TELDQLRQARLPQLVDGAQKTGREPGALLTGAIYLIETIEGTATSVAALDGIATDGRTLDLGAALSSCAGGAPSTASLHVTLYQNPYNPDTGTAWVTIAGVTSSYDYDTSQDTAGSVAEALSFAIDSQYVHATYTGGGNISITTLADGPFTTYSMTAGVSNDCDPPDESAGLRP
ncbi:MAG: hypothetical protein ACRD1C_13850, partial [Terriglobales bacterium]